MIKLKAMLNLKAMGRILTSPVDRLTAEWAEGEIRKLDREIKRLRAVIKALKLKEQCK